MMANGFPPELTSARLNYEMAKELSDRGHRVNVATILPRTRYGRTSEVPSGRLFHREEISDNLSVLRVGLRITLSEGLIGRGFQYLLMPIWLALGVLVSPRPDVILCESPPLLVGVAAHLMSKVKRSPFIIRIQDIHPDVLQESGLVRNRFLIALMRMIERFIYAKAALVTTISPSYRARIVSKGVPPEKVKYVPNWADEKAIESAKPGEIRRRLELTNAFLITYAGTMSWFQDLESVLAAAKILEPVSQVRFLFVGDGVTKANLVKQAANLSLKNVIFLPFQQKGIYYDMIKSSDVCLVSLKKSVTTPEMPSKMLEIMMAGTPILANVPETSDISEVVRQANCGLIIEPENPEAFARGVLQLYQNRSDLSQLGLNGRHHASSNFSLRSSIDSLETLFLTMEEPMGHIPQSPGAIRIIGSIPS